LTEGVQELQEFRSCRIGEGSTFSREPWAKLGQKTENRNRSQNSEFELMPLQKRDTMNIERAKDVVHGPLYSGISNT
jgi:hypothetical protein